MTLQLSEFCGAFKQLSKEFRGSSHIQKIKSLTEEKGLCLQGRHEKEGRIVMNAMYSLKEGYPGECFFHV